MIAITNTGRSNILDDTVSTINSGDNEAYVVTYTHSSGTILYKTIKPLHIYQIQKGWLKPYVPPIKLFSILKKILLRARSLIQYKCKFPKHL